MRQYSVSVLLWMQNTTTKSVLSMQIIPDVDLISKKFSFQFVAND